MPLAARLPRTRDLRELLALALPVISVQLGMMAMGVVDTIMVGHLSPAALAAVALGNVYYFGASIFGMGALMALDPVVAQAVGANDPEGVARGVQRGMVLAVLLCIPTALVLLPAPAVLTWLRQPPEVAPLAGAYAQVSIPGTIGVFAFVVLRQSLQALGRMRPILVTIVVANLVNAVLNWLLIFGHGGFPAMGAVGSAWASTIARLFMAVLLPLLAWPLLRQTVLPLRRAVLEPRPLLRMLRLGAPIGAQHQLEYGVFGVVGLLMGSMGTVQVAGHQVALNLASITFMVPLGLSSAAAVVVGRAVGRNDAESAWESAQGALLVAVAFMGTTAICFLLLPQPLARIYTVAPEVLAVAGALIPLAGVFQVFDGIQVTSIGILRGLGDTRTPMIIGVLGFWLVGLPVSLLLAFRLNLGAPGLWWGLVLGLVFVASLLLARVRWKLRQPLRRVLIDHSSEFPVQSVG
ncbi:MAG TPA: MATE family efflux transporter [Gemmatimonadales bacterium]|nr:MATE family efflux transporter [Gemmatimonadales bacterium]